MKSFSPWLFCLLLPLLAACGSSSSTQESPVLGSGELRWVNFPVPLYVEAQILQDADALQDLNDAIAFWEEKAGKPLFTLQGAYAGLPYTGDPADPTTLLGNGIYFLSPWPFEANEAGRTLVYSTGANISSSAIVLNSTTEMCTGDCVATGDNQKTSRRRLLAHELGHFLGFNHTNDSGNIMYPAILPGGSLNSVVIDSELLGKLTN